MNSLWLGPIKVLGCCFPFSGSGGGATGRDKRRILGAAWICLVESLIYRLRSLSYALSDCVIESIALSPFRLLVLLIGGVSELSTIKNVMKLLSSHHDR